MQKGVHKIAVEKIWVKKKLFRPASAEKFIPYLGMFSSHTLSTL